MKKRVLSLFLALVMVLGLLPAAALPAKAVDLSWKTPASITSELDTVGDKYTDEFIAHYNPDIGKRYSYDGDDLDGDGNAAIISTSGGKMFNHVGELYHLKAYSCMLSGYIGNKIGETAVRSGAQTKEVRLYLSEDGSDRFQSSNIGYYPFALSVYVPANAIKTVRFDFTGAAARGSKGAAGYYLELFHWGDTYEEFRINGTQFMTGDTSRASQSGYVLTPNGMAKGQRAYWNTNSGGSFTASEDVTFVNDSGKDKWITEYFGYYAGVGRSSSALGSYHHKMVTEVKITQTVLSVQQPPDIVAWVGGAYYTSIEEAVEAFNTPRGDGKAHDFTLNKDVGSAYGRVTLTGAGTVDLGGHTWSEKQFTVNGRVTVKNGALSGVDGGGAVTVESAGTLTTGPDLTVDVPLTVRGAMTVDGVTTVNGDITVSGTALLKSSLALSGTIRLSKGGQIAGSGAAPAAKYKLVTDAAPTATERIVLSDVDYNPNDWFNWAGKPGCMLDRVGNQPVVRLKKVKLNANGGILPNGETELYTTAAGTASLPTPVKTGYASEWRNADGTAVDQNSTFTDGETLTAQWTANDYTVTFDKNYEGAPAADTRTIQFDSKYTLPSEPTRTGYDFTGWYTAETDGVRVTADTTLTEARNHTLYAHWNAKRVTVSFIADGGSAYKTKTVTFDKTYGTLPRPTKEGYQFAGWYTDKDGGTQVETITSVTNAVDHTLYAHWTVRPVKVTFDLNYDGCPDGDVKTIDFGKHYVLPDTEPTREGWSFKGWYTSDVWNAGEQITSSSTVTRATDHRIYAMWERGRCTVTFDGNKPVGASGEVTMSRTEQSVSQGSRISRPGAPWLTDYDFEGWYTDAACKTPWDFSAAVTGDITLYAKWGKKTYTIYFYAGSGKFDTTDGKSELWRSLAASDLIEYTKMTEKPTREKYTFKEWVTDEGEAPTAGPLTGKVSLYPKWELEKVTFTLDAQGGAVSENSISLPVTAVVFGSSLPTPTNGSKAFVGWFTASEGGKLVESTTEVSTVSERTLYAHWAGTHTHYVEGADGADGAEVVFEEWTEGQKAIRDGSTHYLYLSKDVTCTNTALTITSGTVHLCLNGYTLNGQAGSNGAVNVSGSGSIFHLYDCSADSKGKLTNTAGHGVTVSGGGAFYMHGGVINECAQKGVYIKETSSFTMTGGEISGNRCGISIADASTTVSLKNGKISGNTPDGGIISSSYEGSKLTLENMEIVGNYYEPASASYLGSGLCVTTSKNTGCSVELKGKVVIRDNQLYYKNKTFTSNAYMQFGTSTTSPCFTLNGDLEPGSYIGVYPGYETIDVNKTIAVCASEEIAAANAQYFVYEGDKPSLCCTVYSNYPKEITLRSGTQTIPPDPDPGADEEDVLDVPQEGEVIPVPPGGGDDPGGEGDNSKHEHKPCGETSCTHSGHSVIEYTALEGTTLPGGSAYLMEDADSLTVSGNANLCLNGRKVTALSITGGTLTLCDCQGGGSVGTITFSGGGKLSMPIPRPETPYSVTVDDNTPFATGWDDSMGDPGDYFKVPEGKEILTEGGGLTVADKQPEPPKKPTVTVVQPDGAAVELTVKDDGTIDMDLLPENSGTAPAGQLPDGWTTDPNGGGEAVTGTTTFTEDTRLYPHWKNCEHTGDTDWQETETVAATCTEDGYKVLTCQVCHLTRTEETPAKGHTVDESTWKCDGNFHWHECSACQGKFNLAVHTLSGDGTVTSEPNCTADGSRTFTCECGQTTAVTIPALGHDFSGDWAHDDTQHWRKCARTGCAAEDPVKENHAWVSAGVTQEPTTEAAGLEKFTCVCGAEKTQTIAKLEPVPGHEPSSPTYNATFVYGPHKDPTEETDKKENESITVPTPGARTGYTFTQWNWFALSGGGAGQAAAGGAFTMPASNVVFTALWAREDSTTLSPGDKLILDDGTVIENQGGTVTIDRDGDGRAEVTITPPSGTVSVEHKTGGDGNETDVIKVPEGTTVKTDKEYLQPDDAEPERKDGPTITVGGETEVDLEGNVTLPAGSTIEDEDGNTVTITEGAGKVEPDGATTFPDGGTVTIKDKNGGETEIEIPEPVEGVEPPEITAQKYTVTFDMQGHGTPIESVTVYSGSKLVQPEDPTAEGYTFGGWYFRGNEADEGNPTKTKWNFATDTVSCDVTLYAKWTAVGSSAEPSITKQPSDIAGLTQGEIPEGTKLTVTVADPPEGGGKITYQWYEKGGDGVFKPIEDETGPSYTIPGNTPAGTREYYCEITNTEDGKAPATVTTDTVTVTVNAAHEHDWDNWRITKDPTLTETGTAERVCKTNSSHTESKELPVLTDTSVWTEGDKQEPTEDVDGYQKYTSEYGKVTVVIPATGHTHDWGDWRITKEPTLSETGTAKRVCKTNSSHTESKELPVLTDTSVWTEDEKQEPTEDVDGYQKYTSEYGKVTVVIPATGHTHDWGGWSITKEPTLSETGTAKRVCITNSSHTESKELPVLTDTRVWTPDDRVEPGENTPGSQKYTSEYGTVTIEIPPTGPKPPAGGKVPLNPGKKVEVDTDGDGNTDVVVERGEDGAVTIDKGGDGTPDVTIETPEDGEVIVDTETGEVEVPGGSTVQPGGGDGPEIKLPEGGKVDPDTGSTTAPKVEVNGTTVTPPTNKTDVTTDRDGNTPVGPGSSVSKGDGGDEVTVKVIEGNGVVDRDGSVTFPNGDGRVEISKGGNTRELEVPKGGSVPTDADKLHDISGKVQENGGNPVNMADVELRQGVRSLASTWTSEDGRFTFYNIPNGVYNIVAKAGDKTKTQIVTLSSKDETLMLTMPSDNVNSIVKVESNVKDESAKVSETVVGGLDEEAEEQKVVNSTVTVTMTIKKEDEKSAYGADQIQTEASGQTVEFLSITVEKRTVVTDGDTTEEKENIPETKKILEIVIPYDFSGKKNVTVYRHHGGTAEKLNRTDTKADGTFKLDESNSLIYIYAQKFSTYAIGYTEEGGSEEPPAPSHIHSWAKGWTSNDTYHWHECIGEGHCDAGDSTPEKAYGRHVYSDDQDTTCNTCGYRRVVSSSSGSGGGSSSPTTYPPVIEKPDHGIISVSPKRPEWGDKVTVTLTPDEGYRVDEITVTDRSGKPISVTARGNGTYTFTQPGGKVTISASFKPDGSYGSCPRNHTCPVAKFLDASPAAWYHDGIHYCIEHGLMVGLNSHTFAPGGDTSRAMIAAILWRLEGSPVVNYILPFDDVAEGAWYAEAVRWAAANGIVSGYDARTFGPGNPITREQLAAMLYRYQQYKDGGFTGVWVFPLDFEDAGQVSNWAYEPMCWITMNGIIKGVGNSLLNPKGQATRAQAATMIMRFCMEK